MAHVPSLFVHLDFGIVFLKKLGSVTLLTLLLRGNLRHIFLRVHFLLVFICILVSLLLLLFLELVKRSWTLYLFILFIYLFINN